MFTIPFNRDHVLVTSLSDASTLIRSSEMTELMNQMRDPSQTMGGSVGSIPQSIGSSVTGGGGGGSEKSLHQALYTGIHSTPASNLKAVEAMRQAKHDGSPSIFSPKMAASKSYTSGLSHSAGAVTTTGNLSLFGEISPNHSHFFEVMYVGKIKVSHKRVPETFIDDALPKFRAYDSQRMARLKEQAMRRNSNASDTSETDMSRVSSEEFNKPDGQTGGGDSNKPEQEPFQEKVLGTSKLQDENKENSSPSAKPEFLRMQSQFAIPVVAKNDGVFQAPAQPRQRPEEIPPQRHRSASIGTVTDQNRTMVFLVGLTDIRLISPDRKQVLLYKDYKDIASCAQGHANADHFGIICRETSNDGFIAYVFKCQSDSVADDIVQAISLAFISCSEQKMKEKSQILSCDHCPMLWFHKLCNDIEGLNEKKTHNMILKRIETLNDEEQEIIMAKFHGAEEVSQHTLVQQVQFLMMLLRAHCESRQQRHVHDTAESRSEFLNQYLGGSTIFMKAKRSLSNSFDHLLKRKSIKDDSTAAAVPEFRTQLSNRSSSDDQESGTANRKHTMALSPCRPTPPEQLKSPMMDIFMKVGNNPRDHEDHGSWRQTMLHKLSTPSKALHTQEEIHLLSPYRKRRSAKKTKEDLRELWRTAIRQTILLSRMERENACLQARQNENEIKKIKLEYDEILSCDKKALEIWDMYIDKESPGKIFDPKVLLQAIKKGVPRSKRGEVWMFLAEQFAMDAVEPVDVTGFPNYNVPYATLLKNLTEHQHAIFIDLGRTFPKHNYYKQPLGLGQLSLFNLLKAYSILDPELGYCQGLGFICAVILLHADEADAFELLKHLMFKRQMRTKYLPDMKQFQLQLYQLSRLLKDTLPDLYDWLDRNDISPTLYAAPWFLTAFSSQFPLGFVTKVFDLMFLESSDVIFSVVLSLLHYHKDALMARSNFEDIMDYMKNAIPNIDAVTIACVLEKTFSMDLQRQLAEYQVEYTVLQEEISSQNNHLALLNTAKEESRQFETQLQIAQSNIAQLEKTRFTQQNQIQSLQSQVQSLEVTVETIGHFINQLIDTRHDIEFPGDIRRIAQQIQNADQRKQTRFVERKISKSLSMTSHLGSMLKVLQEEGNEGEQSPKARAKKYASHFEEMQFQKSAMTLNTVDIGLNEGDSGIATPLSPLNGGRKGEKESNSDEDLKEEQMHPLSECKDVNFRFSGAPLKSLTRLNAATKSPTGTIPRQVLEKNGRS